MKLRYSFIFLLFLSSVDLYAQRSIQTLKEGWQFCKGDAFEESRSQRVRVPHDWAIYGPFNRKHDLQVVAVEQNGEKEATVKTALYR